MERNKGDTPEKAVPIPIEEKDAHRFRQALIRLLERIEVQTSDKAQQEDIKTIFQLLEHFPKQA